MITTYFKLTIEYLIDNFRQETKRHFNLSFTFAIVSCIASAVIAAVFILTASLIWGTFSLIHFTEDINGFASNEYNKFYNLVYALSMLCIGLYSSFIISCINDEGLSKKEKYTWADFRAFISKEEWAWFGKFVLALLVVYFVFFRSLKSLCGVGMGSSHSPLPISFPADEYMGLSATQIFLSRLLTWTDSIIALFKTYLPYLLVTLFVITVYENKLDKTIIRKYRNGLWSALAIAFVINVLSLTVSNYFSKYIIGFLDIFFFSYVSLVLPAVLQIVFILVLVALLNWTVAAAFCMPIKLVAEEGFRAESAASALRENA